MIIQKSNNLIDSLIPSNAIISKKTFLNYIEIKYMDKKNNQILIKKINKKNYVFLPTGEIKLFRHTINRSESLSFVTVSLSRARDLINANFKGGDNELSIVLTYSGNMMNEKKLNFDFNNLIKSLRKDYGHFEYIAIDEPQGRGAWHVHLLIKFNDYAFIEKKDLDKKWNYKGWTFIKKINSVKGMGFYLSAYLSDMEFNQDNVKLLKGYGLKKGDLKIKFIENEGKSKRYIKGARLFLYPTGKRIYRKSKGIKYPLKENMRYKEAKEDIRLKKDAEYIQEINLLDDNLKVVNTIINEQYTI